MEANMLHYDAKLWLVRIQNFWWLRSSGPVFISATGQISIATFSVFQNLKLLAHLRLAGFEGVQDTRPLGHHFLDNMLS